MLVPSVMAGEGSASKSIPLALPPAVSPPGGEDAADIDFTARPASGPDSAFADASANPIRSEEVTRPLRREPVETVAVAASRHESRKGGSRLLGTMYLILSLGALGAWVLHQFFSGTHPIEGKLLWASDPNFIGLPAAFWSTVFLSLAIALFLEGVYRMRRT